MADARHRTVEADGIRVHLAEQGEGPLVLLCHGFPETWYSGRHPMEKPLEVNSLLTDFLRSLPP